MKKLSSIATLGIVLAMSCAASTAPPRSGSPTGVYKLSTGVYVPADVGCENPPNAEIKEYNGRGIDTAHTSRCVAHVLSSRVLKDGTAYTVSQTCNDAGDGSGKNYSETQNILVKNPTHFAILSEGRTVYKDRTVYSRCPANELPADLRGARSD